jgi:hypothetical protein
MRLCESLPARLPACCTALQAAAAFAANNETMGNALEKLSEELYSSDVHFVLELVQVRKCTMYALLPVWLCSCCIWSGHTLHSLCAGAGAGECAVLLQLSLSVLQLSSVMCFVLMVFCCFVVMSVLQ